MNKQPQEESKTVDQTAIEKLATKLNRVSHRAARIEDYDALWLVLLAVADAPDVEEASTRAWAAMEAMYALDFVGYEMMEDLKAQLQLVFSAQADPRPVFRVVADSARPEVIAELARLGNISQAAERS